MTQTTVMLENCVVNISPDEIAFIAHDVSKPLTVSYEEFNEILEAVARNEKFLALG